MAARLKPGTRLPILVAVICALWLWLGSGTDFMVYHQAARSFLNSGWSAGYGQGGLTPFKYSPPALLAMAPLGLVPVIWAKFAWAVINGLAVWDLQRRLLVRGIGAGSLALALVILVHGLSWQALLANVTFLMVWGLVAIATTESARVRGIGTAVLIAVKPFWLAIVPVLLVGRQWRTLAVALVTLIVLAALPFVTGLNAGVEAYQAWLPTLTDPLHAHNFPKHDNQSWWGLLYRHRELLDWWLTPLWLIGSGAMMLTWLIALWRAGARASRSTLAILGVAPVVLWAGPLSWLHHQLFLWPLLAAMWQERSRREIMIPLAGAAAVLLLITPMVLGRELTITLELAGLPLLAFPLALAGAIMLLRGMDQPGDDLPSPAGDLPSTK